MRKGFTLIELLVVIAMILIIAGSMTTATGKARRRAKMDRANVEARELTNAILAYQNYTEDGTLSECEMDDAEAEVSKLGFILGKARQRGQQVPVLYNAAVAGSKIIDPWNKPYRVTIKRGQPINPPGVPSMGIRPFYPNWHRVGGHER